MHAPLRMADVLGDNGLYSVHGFDQPPDGLRLVLANRLHGGLVTNGNRQHRPGLDFGVSHGNLIGSLRVWRRSLTRSVKGWPLRRRGQSYSPAMIRSVSGHRP